MCDDASELIRLWKLKRTTEERIDELKASLISVHGTDIRIQANNGKDSVSIGSAVTRRVDMAKLEDVIGYGRVSEILKDKMSKVELTVSDLKAAGIKDVQDVTYEDACTPRLSVKLG